MVDGPKTLLEAVEYFKNEDNCIRYLAAKRWPNGVVICPICGSDRVGYLGDRRDGSAAIVTRSGSSRSRSARSWKTRLSRLDKWMPVLWLIANCRNGISSWEIHRALGVTQKTAWFMLHRVRLAMQDNFTGGKLGGEVEVDETFIGGKARNMHKDKRAEKITGRGPEGKAIVAAVLERGGKVRAKVVETRRKKALQALVRDNVEVGSALYSDALKSYEGLRQGLRASSDRPCRSLCRRADSH
jgi:transposase-like protein